MSSTGAGFVDSSELNIHYHLETLNSNFSALLEKHQQLAAEVAELQSKYADKEKAFQPQVADLTQSSAVCLIDGDGCIFSKEYISQGGEGGKSAARALFKGITDFLQDKCSISPDNIQLSIFVFLHKNGLANPLKVEGYIEYPLQFDKFLWGFSSAGSKILVVDVGPGKEAADNKLKAFLRDSVQLSPTSKVFVGVSHDNGYAFDIEQLITEGYRDKLILLQGYDNLAVNIKALNLPILYIPGLFIAEKLPDSSSRSPNPQTTLNTPESSPGKKPRGLSFKDGRRTSNNSAGRPRLLSSPREQPSTILDDMNPAFISALGLQDGSALTDLESELGDGPPVNLPTLTFGQLDPLDKPEESPCPVHYIRGICKSKHRLGSLSHDLELSPDEIKQLAEKTKAEPCWNMVTDGYCGFKDKCIYAHTCPNGPECSQLKDKTCKFNEKMHA